jgi:hypothetical protein
MLVTATARTDTALLSFALHDLRSLLISQSDRQVFMLDFVQQMTQSCDRVGRVTNPGNIKNNPSPVWASALQPTKAIIASEVWHV